MTIEEVKRELKLSIAIIKDMRNRETLSRNQVLAYEDKLRQSGVGIPCQDCNRIMSNGFSDISASVDHIVPRNIVEMFGIDCTTNLWVDNLRVICRRCNMFKSNRLDFKEKRTKQLLQELINKL